MRNEKAEFDWEVLPWGFDDKDEDYCIYVERGEKWHPQMNFGNPRLIVSNQSDCAETFCLGSVEELDAFVARLLKARAWLAQQ